MGCPRGVAGGEEVVVEAEEVEEDLFAAHGGFCLLGAVGWFFATLVPSCLSPGVGAGSGALLGGGLCTH